MPYSVFLTNRRTFLALMNNFIAGAAILYPTATTVPHLINAGVKEMDAGSALALCWLTYVVGCPFVAKLYQLTDRKTCMVLSMALCAASFVLIGPS